MSNTTVAIEAKLATAMVRDFTRKPHRVVALACNGRTVTVVGGELKRAIGYHR